MHCTHHTHTCIPTYHAYIQTPYTHLNLNKTHTKLTHTQPTHTHGPHGPTHTPTHTDTTHTNCRRQWRPVRLPGAAQHSTYEDEGGQAGAGKHVDASWWIRSSTSAASAVLRMMGQEGRGAPPRGVRRDGESAVQALGHRVDRGWRRRRGCSGTGDAGGGGRGAVGAAVQWRHVVRRRRRRHRRSERRDGGGQDRE
jgi:hypothetical protein